MKLLRPLDIFVVCIIVATGVATVFLFKGAQGARAEVYIEGRKAATFSLAGEEQTKKIPTRIGNIDLVYGIGTIHVQRSPCNQKICILQGAIQHTHEKIICVPARMVITISNSAESENPHSDIDAISY